MSQDLISEFEAAQKMKLSPTLLRWFTSYAAKDDGRKLKCEIKKGVYYYNKKELIDFNSYLQTPWKKPVGGQRPTIPQGIATEIKTESGYKCPICNTNIGELAHIQPVAKTFNNHPHNLIYLCPNHHTVYDFGFRYNNISKEDIQIHKAALLSFQTIRWGLQSEIVFNYLSLINTIGRVKDLEEQLLEVNEEEFKELLRSILKKIGTLKEKKSGSKEVIKIIESVNTDSKQLSKVAYSFLEVREDIKKEYQQDADLVSCPLCHSKGSTDFFDICPVCAGDGFISREQEIDISLYEMEDCVLCKGKGYTKDFEVCPPCNGIGQLTREQLENVDFSIYEMEDCTLCKGKGYTKDFEVCPPCNGGGQLTLEQLENIDFSIYEMEDCALCKGKGYTKDFEVCPPCNGGGQLTREQIENIDFSIYEMEDCPLCKGKGYTSDFEVCPPCRGAGQLTREQIENIDFEDY